MSSRHDEFNCPQRTDQSREIVKISFERRTHEGKYRHPEIHIKFTEIIITCDSDATRGN